MLGRVKTDYFSRKLIMPSREKSPFCSRRSATQLLCLFCLISFYLHCDCVVKQACADTTIDGFSDARNDRFTNDPAFVLNAGDVNNDGIIDLASSFSLSGVGRTTVDGRWATLISDNAFLTAAHRPPTAGSTIAFYPDNDPTATPFTANVVAGGSRVGSTDLYVGYLDKIVDSSIQRYDFATTEISRSVLPDGRIFIHQDTIFQNDLGFIVGISATGRNQVEIDQSVGLNRITGYAENVEFQSNTDNDTFIYEYDSTGDPFYETNEALVRGGDSGAPNFIIDEDDNVLLLGVNSFRLDGEPIDVVDPSSGEIIGSSQFLSSGVTYTGNQAAGINRLITASPTVSSVPEPSSIVVVGLSLMLFSIRRRRS